MKNNKQDQKPLSLEELDTLARFLYRLHLTSRSEMIQRIAKSLFWLVTNQRFSTDDNLPIIK